MTRPSSKAAADANAPVKDDTVRLARAEAILGYTFDVPGLLLEALTHRSFAKEAMAKEPSVHVPNNERLEFLGDAVIGLVAADVLRLASPEADEGELTRRRAAYVSRAYMADAAQKHRLGPLIRVGKDVRATGKNAVASVLANVVEGLVGAVYVEAGLEAAARVTHTLLGDVPSADTLLSQDPKSVLQEAVQAVAKAAPSYVMESRSGPSHAPVFEVSVRLFDRELGRGSGANKKSAAQAAARGVLDQIESLSAAELRAWLKVPA